jgi:cytochrome c-type biogenesis protein CcmF
MEISYIGEQLAWGWIGNLLVVLSFTAALLSAAAYWYGHRTGEASWKRLARTAFGIHSVSVISIIGLLLFLITQHRFEYYYVWEHSNTKMPMRYILSCLWEGQEGSFLLWTFWHVLLGWVLIRRSGIWEDAVMFIVSIAQVFLASMILGVVIFGYKLGSNPFTLLREHPDFAQLPFIRFPDYLQRLKDGRGLNPLLQNYWMTIHPPTLFLGFATTIIPFAYAMGGLLRKQYDQWIRPALPWTFFSIMILGTGILMGAAWAYESLSFGGFWAWDPVENASLVPWMTLAGLGHVMLIYRHRGRALWSNYILAVVTFFFILYSTFLTRSGILGNSSVHAFTDLGMSGQLLVYMLFFVALAAFLLVRHRKEIPVGPEEEHFSSREFWMFIGMLVLAIGSLQITFTTSTPVINKVFGTKLAPPADPIDHYNRWQVPVAILLSLLIATAQFFRYKQTEWKTWLNRISLSVLAAALLTFAMVLALGSFRYHYYALLFASLFAVTANLDYFIRVLKGRFRNAGASIAHIGIGLILCGALVSNGKKQVISQNLKNVDLGKDFPNRENIMLEQGLDTLPMGNYYVTYTGKEQDGIHVYYKIGYFNQDVNGQKVPAFELRPFVQLNERMGNVAEPATKHFLTKDIYTHITYAELEKKDATDTSEFQAPKSHMMAVGDTVFTSNSFVILQGLDKNPASETEHLHDNDIAVGAQLLVQDINKRSYTPEPIFLIRDMSLYTKPAAVQELGLQFEFNKIDPSSGKIELIVREKKSNKRDFVIMKAIVFPGINILWTGCILMIIGTVLAVRHRLQANRAIETR